jgi:hypothetical protein
MMFDTNEKLILEKFLHEHRISYALAVIASFALNFSQGIPAILGTLLGCFLAMAMFTLVSWQLECRAIRKAKDEEVERRLSFYERVLPSSSISIVGWAVAQTTANAHKHSRY